MLEYEKKTESGSRVDIKSGTGPKHGVETLGGVVVDIEHVYL